MVDYNEVVNCVVPSVIPTYIFIIYVFAYLTAFIVVSIKAFSDQQNSLPHSSTRSRAQGLFTDCKAKKKCYLHVLPHILDQATDIAVIIQFYKLSQSDDTQYCGGLSMLSFFIISICILGGYRLISCLMIGARTHSAGYVLNQLLDIELIRSVYVNYKTHALKPNFAQTWIVILEATFESAPQFVLQLVFAARTGIIIGFGIFHVSIIVSLATVIMRTATDDMMMPIKTKKKRDFIAFRFFDITTRLLSLSLVWILWDGYLLAAIFGVEGFILIVISAKTHNWELLHFILKAQFPYNLYIIRIIETGVIILAELIILILFRSSYNSIDLTLCVVVAGLYIGYCVTGFALRLSINTALNKFEEPCLLHYAIIFEICCFSQNKRDKIQILMCQNFNTSRRLEKLIIAEQWDAVRDMIEYGSETTDWMDVLTKKNLKQMMSDDVMKYKIFKKIIDKDPLFSEGDVQTLWTRIFDIMFDNEELTDGCLTFADILHGKYRQNHEFDPNKHLVKGNLLKYSILNKNKKSTEFLLSLDDIKVDEADIGAAIDMNVIHSLLKRKNIKTLLLSKIIPDPVKLQLLQYLKNNSSCFSDLFTKCLRKYVELSNNNPDNNVNNDIEEEKYPNAHDVDIDQYTFPPYIISLIEMLIKKYNVDINQVYFDLSNQTPLGYLISHFHHLNLKLMELFLNYGSKYDKVLQLPAKIEIAFFLIEHHHQFIHSLIWIKENIHSRNINDVYRGSTLLMHALNQKWKECIDFLVKNWNNKMKIYDESLFTYYQKNQQYSHLIQLINYCLSNNIKLRFNDVDLIEIAAFIIQYHNSLHQPLKWMKHHVNCSNVNDVHKGETLLMHALNKKWEECIDFLLKIRLNELKIYNESLFAYYHKNKQNSHLIQLVKHCFSIEKLIFKKFKNYNIEKYNFVEFACWIIRCHESLDQPLEWIERKITPNNINTPFNGLTLLQIARRKNWSACIHMLEQNQNCITYGKYLSWNRGERIIFCSQVVLEKTFFCLSTNEERILLLSNHSKLYIIGDNQHKEVKRGQIQRVMISKNKIKELTLVLDISNSKNMHFVTSQASHWKSLIEQNMLHT